MCIISPLNLPVVFHLEDLQVTYTLLCPVCFSIPFYLIYSLPLHSWHSTFQSSLTTPCYGFRVRISTFPGIFCLANYSSFRIPQGFVIPLCPPCWVCCFLWVFTIYFHCLFILSVLFTWEVGHFYPVTQHRVRQEGDTVGASEGSHESVQSLEIAIVWIWNVS
jgi:hypothetical protein